MLAIHTYTCTCVYLASQQNKKKKQLRMVLRSLKDDHGLDGKWFSKRVTTDLHQGLTCTSVHLTSFESYKAL